MSDLANPIFTNEKAARTHLESLIWANGRYCPHCGATEGTSFVRGKKHRPGLYYCNSCKKQFTVTVGTLFERSKIPLHKWLLAFHLMASSKKGMSAHQMHRMLGVSYKTAWFMAHRIREAMRPIAPDKKRMGGNGKIVEADETYIGGKEKNKHRTKRTAGNIGGQGKEVVFSLVQRGGKVRSQHVANTSAVKLSAPSSWRRSTAIRP
jgi:transposase-like protein